jgi:hypothetical protein
MQLAAFALAALASAGAAAPSQPDNPLAAFPDYSHPEVTADNCAAKDPSHTVCYIPAKTMGRYVIDVTARSTATGPDATQAIAIGGPGWLCGQTGSKKGDWASGSRTLVAQCVVTVLNDTPVQVVVSFGGADATPDPKGPVVSIHRLAWNGVIESGSFQAAVQGPAPAKK